MNVKKTQWIYKGIAAILAITLVFGLVMMGKDLQPKGPAELSGNTQDILPEAKKAIPDQTDRENSQEGHDETEPPETEPPETEPPETKPEETEPPKTKPQEEVPPQTEPEATQPDETQPNQDPKPEDNTGGNGDTDDEGGGETKPEEGPEDDSELRIVTDLHNGEVTFNNS